MQQCMVQDASDHSSETSDAEFFGRKDKDSGEEVKEGDEAELSGD